MENEERLNEIIKLAQLRENVQLVIMTRRRVENLIRKRSLEEKKKREESEKVALDADNHLHERAEVNSINDIAKPRKNTLTKFLLSVASPRYFSKRLASKIIIHLYVPKNHKEVKAYLQKEFGEQEIQEVIRSSEFVLKKRVKVMLESPDIEFSNPVENILETNSQFLFLGRPKDNCKVGSQQVLLEVLDSETEEMLEAWYLEVKVVDFVFDHVSRPLISSISSVVLGLGSLVMFILTLLGQIDSTFGFTSGATAGLLASLIYARYFIQYQLPKSSIP